MKAYRIGIGSVITTVKVEEPAGYKGQYITISESNRKDKLRIGRKGRRVYKHRPKLI